MKIANKKRIPYGRQTISNHDIAMVANVLKSDFITQGPKIKEFEDVLCRYTGAKYAVAVSSGTAALHIACLAAGIKKGDEVITSPVTFVASANCILYCGGKPVFADIQKDTANIDPVEIEKAVTNRTKAIIPVHFAGHPCDLIKISKVAKKYNLMVIEDACHALGAEYPDNKKRVKIGSCRHSDMTVFSFHPVKAITTGEGGTVLTNKKDLYERLLIFRNHGITKDPSRFLIYDPRSTDDWYYEMQELGFNYRITDFQCALGISQLKKLNTLISKRRGIAGIYNRELSGSAGIMLPRESSRTKSAYHLYPVRLTDCAQRKDVFAKLRESGIGVQVHYIPVHLQPYYRKHFGYKDGSYPYAEDYYKSAITLPLYPELKRANIEYIVRTLRSLVG